MKRTDLPLPFEPRNPKIPRTWYEPEPEHRPITKDFLPFMSLNFPRKVKDKYARPQTVQLFKEMHKMLVPIYEAHGATRLRELCSCIKNEQIRHYILIHAIYYDYKDVVETFLQQRLASRVHPLDWAAFLGKQHMFVFIEAMGTEEVSPRAMDIAAQNGHLEMVKFLHVRKHKCTSDAMDLAAKFGHYDVVLFLHENRTEGCTTDAMDKAAGLGKLDLVKFLHENRAEGCTKKAMDKAAKGGHIRVLEFLHKNRSEGCTAIVAMEAAARRGHTEIVRWLHEVRGERIPPGSWTNETEIGRYYNEHKSCTCAVKALENSAAAGDLLVVKSIFRGQRKYGPNPMDVAATNGHLEVLTFLHEHKQTCTTAAMDGAIANGHLKVVQFLHAFRTEGFSKDAMYQAIENGHIEIVNWLAANPVASS
ncbi:unnamed protein product [Aphanomyces euteiches]